MTDDANERADAHYKEGYLAAYRLALSNIQRGVSAAELRQFVVDELEPWAQDLSPENRFVPAPAFKPK